MSCSQVTSEFSRDKFLLKCTHPVTFWVWRYTCFSQDRSFAVYRVLFASLLILLLILDFLWTVGFAGAGEDNRLSACLDASTFALVSLCLAHVLLACGANRWHQLQWETNAEHTIPYKLAWFIYTYSVNAVFVTMIIFWVSVGPTASLEQQLKHVIPGCLIVLDLCLTGIPLFLCHVIYVILVYLFYLTLVILALFLSYTFGAADKNSPEAGSPTVWVGGCPLLPDGYADFSNLHRILSIVFGSMALAVVVHCLLLSLVITRDFFASLFRCSTEMWMVDGNATDSQVGDQLFNRQSSSNLAGPSTSIGSVNGLTPIYGDNPGFEGALDVKQ